MRIGVRGEAAGALKRSLVSLNLSACQTALGSNRGLQTQCGNVQTHVKLSVVVSLHMKPNSVYVVWALFRDTPERIEVCARVAPRIPYQSKCLAALEYLSSQY